VAQFLLSPLLLWRSFVATLLSNALYGAAFSYYHYITFLGYSSLPFLSDTVVRLHCPAGNPFVFIARVHMYVKLPQQVQSIAETATVHTSPLHEAAGCRDAVASCAAVLGLESSEHSSMRRVTPV